MRNFIHLSALLISVISLNSQASQITDNTLLFEAKVLRHIELMNTHTSNIINLSCDTQKDQIIKNWETAYSNYLAISYMNLEVITNNALNYSFAFWPDKKNLIGKKMKSLLAKTDINAADIGKSSAPVKGYQAIEYLLFDKSQTKINCTAIKAIVINMLDNIKLINAQLKQLPIIKSEFLTNQREIEGASIAFNQISNHLSAIIKKVTTITNDKKNEKLYFSDAWRSKQALHFHKNNVNNAIEYIQIMSGLLSEQSQKTLQPQILQLNIQLSKFPSNYFEIYTQKKETLLFHHAIALNKLNTTLSNVILADLNITLGFNNSDGD